MADIHAPGSCKDFAGFEKTGTYALIVFPCAVGGQRIFSTAAFASPESDDMETLREIAIGHIVFFGETSTRMPMQEYWKRRRAIIDALEASGSPEASGVTDVTGSSATSDFDGLRFFEITRVQYEAISITRSILGVPLGSLAILSPGVHGNENKAFLFNPGSPAVPEAIDSVREAALQVNVAGS